MICAGATVSVNLFFAITRGYNMVVINFTKPTFLHSQLLKKCIFVQYLNLQSPISNKHMQCDNVN